MNFLLLLKPSLKRFGRVFSKRNRGLLLVILTGAVLFFCGIYIGITRFLTYVSNPTILLGDTLAKIVGAALISKFLEMLFMALAFMLLFSGIISALSILFLDKDLQTLMVSPQPVSRIFMSRFVMLVFDSSWMAVIFFLPVFLAFAKVLNASALAYICFPFILLCFILIPNIIGAGGSLLLATFFPIRQMKKVFQFISIIMLTGLIFFIRSLEAEKLLNPTHFKTSSNYLINLQLPLKYSPISWMHQTTLDLFKGNFAEAFNHFFPLISVVIIGIIILIVLAFKYYHYSWQKSCEAMDNQLIGLEWLRKLLIFPLKTSSPDLRVIISKEITIFLRDPAIFSQIFMMIAIIAIYGYNLAIIPIKDVPSMFSKGLNNALLFLNGPFIGFILASIGMRFVYPSISLEGRAFWAVKSSPVSPKRVLIIKILFYLLPMTILSLILCAVSNSVFTVSTPALTWLSYFNVLLITMVTTSLAIGVGSVNADFNADSPLKIAGSYGGFIYMILDGLYIINLLLLESYPIYCFNYSNIYHVRGMIPTILFYFNILIILITTMAWIYLPIKKGLEAIEEYEPEL